MMDLDVLSLISHTHFFARDLGSDTPIHSFSEKVLYGASANFCTLGLSHRVLYCCVERSDAEEVRRVLESYVSMTAFNTRSIIINAKMVEQKCFQFPLTTFVVAMF